MTKLDRIDLSESMDQIGPNMRERERERDEKRNKEKS